MADQKHNNSRENDGRIGRLIFGIFMCFVYAGVGVLFFTGFFSAIDTTVSYIVGALLCLYAIWRAYRLYKMKGYY